jgi:hypothetical protein
MKPKDQGSGELIQPIPFYPSPINLHAKKKKKKKKNFLSIIDTY